MLIRVGLSLALLVTCACSHAIDSTIADAAITAAVKTALLNDPSIDGTLVTVQTVAGVVQLGGKQPTADTAAAVVKIVRQVQGVHDVQANIEVDSSADTVTPVR